jgi:glycyl-tRNA synthetase beta chain
MKKRDLLIEIGCEDLPSWSGEYLREKWIPVIALLFKSHRVNCGDIKFFYTGRRLILLAKDVQERQQDVTDEIYGPPVEISINKEGMFAPAAERFAQSHGTKAKDLLIKEKKGRKVLVAVREEKGKPVTGILGSIMEESIKKTEIPRAMKWNSGDFRFIRPIRWVVALFGEKVIKMEIGGVKSGRYSYGHRVLSPERFSVSDPMNYLDKLLKRFVIFDPDVRFEFARAAIFKKISDDRITFGPDYLRKVSSMVEYPFIEVCRLKDEHMNLPDEIVSAVIKKINGIPLMEEGGKLHSRYVMIFEGHGGKEIRENYQNVLHARMEDAVFFMKKDMQTDFASYTPHLKNIMYSPRWGSVYDRIERFKRIYGVLRSYLTLSDEEEKNILQMISLCKNDLPTLMVAEFPSLEGLIGRVYAEKNGYNSVVSSGIEQHYWPRFSGDRLPEFREARIVSVIVRLETICAFLIEDVIKIKGTGDPYGLKKITNGLLEIIWKEKIEFPLKDAINKITDVFGSCRDEVGERITGFILQRAENLIAGAGITPGIRRAVVSVHRDNLVMLKEKTDALERFFESGKVAKSILVPFIRVANILKQAEDKGIRPRVFDESLLAEKTEKELYEFYRSEEDIKKLLDEKQYDSFLKHLSKWKEIVDRFFDDVLIMCPDERLRDNRLALLRKINELFKLFADFSLIPIVEVEGSGEEI